MVKEIEDNVKMVDEDFCVEPRKFRVTELMKTLKPKKKRPFDKRRIKQVKASVSALGCSTSTTQ